MIGIASGLSASGKTAFAYSIAPFITSRCLDQIRIDVCYHERHVILVGVGGGFVYGSLGATHHAIEDIAIMRALPGMTVIAPADPQEAELATVAAYQHNGPVYLRLGRNNDPVVYKAKSDFIIGRAKVVHEGTDATIIATGTAVSPAIEAGEMLMKNGYTVRVVDMHTVKPIDKEAILDAADTGIVATLEDHTIFGGLGSAVAEVLAERPHSPCAFVRLGLQDVFCRDVGSVEYMRGSYGLDPVTVSKKIMSLIQETRG